MQTREDLRELVYDMQRLPEDQRAALVLAELDALSHTEISEALGVPREKVKALVFQARESLVASRTARETACHDIRAQIANGRGAVLRRGNLRRHLRECDGCREFRAQVDRQRKQFALLLPVAPTIALKEIVLGGTVGGSLLGGGLLAPSALKSAVAKGVIGAMLAGAGTAGTVVVAASDLHLGGLGVRSRPGISTHSEAMRRDRNRAEHRLASGALLSSAPAHAPAFVWHAPSRSQSAGGSVQVRHHTVRVHRAVTSPSAPSQSSTSNQTSTSTVAVVGPTGVATTAAPSAPGVVTRGDPAGNSSSAGSGIGLRGSGTSTTSDGSGATPTVTGPTGLGTATTSTTTGTTTTSGTDPVNGGGDSGSGSNGGSSSGGGGRSTGN